MTYRLMTGSRRTTLATVVCHCGGGERGVRHLQYGILHYDSLGQRPQGRSGIT